MQVAPSEQLLPYIKHYLFLESQRNGLKNLRLFSDGNTGMVFSFKSNLITAIEDNGQFDYLPNTFVYGQLSAFKDLVIKNESSLIIVVFQPTGLSGLLGVPAYDLKDKAVHTEDIVGKAGVFLHEKLSEQVDIHAKLSLLNAYFLALVAICPYLKHQLIQSSLPFIHEKKGLITVNQLVKHTGYTERHIERMFSECVGLNPKKFGNIVKLHHFIKLLRSKSKQNSITDFCYEAGYSDQSHLIREFKKYTGITPTEYINNTNKLAINFIEFDTEGLPMSALYNLLR
jgi:AraC-like DNA-binding protein